jgi:hypothetical protein
VHAQRVRLEYSSYCELGGTREPSTEATTVPPDVGRNYGTVGAQALGVDRVEDRGASRRSGRFPARSRPRGRPAQATENSSRHDARDFRAPSTRCDCLFYSKQALASRVVNSLTQNEENFANFSFHFLFQKP